jgi:Asp-tRNA(Asn)/Glu-tRNA(Gln) amidotransferase A subunit family amidase
MVGPGDFSISEARAALAKGEVNARELTEAQIVAIEAARPLNGTVRQT